jgi:hypothetical protein
MEMLQAFFDSDLGFYCFVSAVITAGVCNVTRRYLRKQRLRAFIAQQKLLYRMCTPERWEELNRN